MTDAYRRSQSKIAQKTAAETRLAYKRYLNVSALDRSTPNWILLTDQIATKGFVRAAQDSRSYLRRFVEAEGGPKGVEFPAVELDHARLAEDLWVNGTYNIKGKIGKGLSAEAAKAAAMKRVMGVVTEYVFDGGRGTVTKVKYSGKSGRWRRVSDGKPCTFCAMLASRGPVYSEESVTFEAHTDCGCTAEPVFGDWEPTGLEAQWREVYAEAASQADAAGEMRIAPKKILVDGKLESGEDTILYRMRRIAPEMFSDGVTLKV